MVKNTVLAAAVLVGLLAPNPAAADPDVGIDLPGSRPGVTPTSRCVTRSEFYAIDPFKTTRAEVEKILDWEGFSASRRSGVTTWKVRRYRGCDGRLTEAGTWRTSKVFIWYTDRDRVQDGVWLINEWVPNRG